MTSPNRPAFCLALLALTVATAIAAPQEADSPQADSLQADMDHARQVHQSADQYDSIALLSDIISRIEGQPEVAPEARQILAAAYFLRAEARFNFAESDQARADLESALEVDPNLEVDAALISPKLAELLTETRARVVGTLLSQVTPPDATILIEGVPPITGGQTVSLLAGEYGVRIERPGFAPIERSLAIAAGQSMVLEDALSRTSAVLHVFTTEPGITVLLDGREAGVTAQTSDGTSALLVSGLQTGPHTVDLQARGFRSRRLELDLGALDDYATDVLALDPMRGTVKLAGVPPGAVLLLNGEERPLPADGPLDLEVPAGDNEIVVAAAGLGRFVSALSVADGQVVGLEVELQPVIALIGVLGGDTRGAQDLQRGLQAFLAGSDAWSVSDRTAERDLLLAGTGLDVDLLRGLSAASAAQIARLDWSALQRACDEKIGASTYLLAVLSDDLFASAADLWILPAAPHPALPQKLRTEIGGAEVLARALAPIGQRPTFHRPWLGARLVETDAAQGLVVLNVTAGSPAEGAGLRSGDVITSVRGVPVERLAALDDMLASMQPQSELQLAIQRPGADTTVSLLLGISPVVVSWTDPDIFYPLYLGWLAIEEATGRSELDAWLIQLNQASALMGLGSWPDAIRLLRGVEAPPGGGVGQAMADYWLGMALIRTDPNQYRDLALQALERALASDAARLYHNDGPRVAPLAAAGIKALSGGP
jgi:hypothetical protein